MSVAGQIDLIDVDAYLSLEAESTTKHEYIGGVLYAMSGGTNRDSQIASNAVASLWNLLRGHQCLTMGWSLNRIAGMRFVLLTLFWLSTVGSGLAQDGWFMPPRLEETVRVEYLLDERPAKGVLAFFRSEYPRVDFSEHPTKNGFFATGPKMELLQLRRELTRLDRLPPHVEPPMVAYIRVSGRDNSGELRALLGTMIPGVSSRYVPELKCLVVEGSPGAIDQVRELLQEGNRDIDQVMSELRFVELTDTGVKSLGLSPRTLKSMTVNATRTEYVNGVKISSKPEVTQVYFRTLQISQ